MIGSKPPHFLTSGRAQDRVLPIDEMYIDVGASSRADVQTALGVRVGDPVVPLGTWIDLGIPGRISGKALDNRIGVALMCETLCGLAAGGHPNTVIGVGAVQEEIGLRGAATAAVLARPDVSVILECTPADDLPGHAERQAVLGSGPQVRLFDPTAVSNRRLARLVEAVAADAEIALQIAVRRSGGTDAGAIQRSGVGVPTVVIGVPARYIHSHVAVMDASDYLAARELTAAVLGRLDARAVLELTDFD